MFENAEWLFFDLGSTIIDERIAYEHRLKGIADLANVPYEEVCRIAVEFYKQNKKGDLETAKFFEVELPGWYTEGEVLYEDAVKSLETLSKKYKIGTIANQALGTRQRLEQYDILKYFDLVIASAEEGVAKPDRRIFEIALERSNCKPDNAVMIGDRIDNDIVPAKLLGIHTIWIRQGFGKYWRIGKEIEKADCAVDSLTELCDLLQHDKR